MCIIIINDIDIKKLYIFYLFIYSLPMVPEKFCICFCFQKKEKQLIVDLAVVC